MRKFLAQDKFGGHLSIEFETIDPLSSQFSEKLNNISESLANAYMPVEVLFARQFHDSLSRDKFLHSLEPLFKNGIDNVEWPLVEEKTKNILKQFFANDFSKSLLANKDICSNYTHFLIVARNKNSSSPIGAIYCLMSAIDDEQLIRVPVFGISPEAQGRGIGKLLMSAILKQIPDAKKIVLSTRITNENALNSYRVWGFVSSPNTMEHWANLEYSVNLSDVLQKTARALTDSS